jgi:LytS/YehU family sensor histidine kinase
MSYMLYESGAPLVSLQKEIGNLENYTGLEQLRFGARLSLSFEKKGPLETVQIPPLLLLAFVENSFKHGISQIAGEGRIHLLLQIQPGELLFHIDNPIGQDRPGESQGIGLKNTIRRLDLLYGAKYHLDLHKEENTFHVTLKIPLP